MCVYVSSWCSSYRWKLENVFRASVYYDQEEVQDALEMENEEEEDDEEETYQVDMCIGKL